MLLFRYWFHKDQEMKWLPIGRQLRRLLDDVLRVWPGPGEEGLHLVQVGSTVPLDDAAEPFLHVSTKRRRAHEYGIVFFMLSVVNLY